MLKGGEMKSQKIQKGGLFDSVDGKHSGKNCGVRPRVGFLIILQTLQKRKMNLWYHTMFLLFAKAMQQLGLTSQKCAYFSLWRFIEHFTAYW